MADAAIIKARGAFGEDVTAEYLAKKGFTIKARNLHVSKYEIDLLAEDENYLVFVEVKTRTVPYLMADGSSPYAITPAMAVTKSKQQKLVSAARLYLLEYPTEKQPRLDVVEVYMKARGASFEVLRIHHIENAFGAS